MLRKVIASTNIRWFYRWFPFARICVTQPWIFDFIPSITCNQIGLLPHFVSWFFLCKPGFDVSSVACCATGMFEMGYMCNRYNAFTCTDASKYVFWDAFHPTEKTNSIISDHLVKHVLAGFFWFVITYPLYNCSTNHIMRWLYTFVVSITLSSIVVSIRSICSKKWYN